MRPLYEFIHLAIDHPTFGRPNPAIGGAFRVQRMNIIATWNNGWDHVSVSTETRCPTWDEMELVKREFFRDDEYAMQLHIPPKAHVNIHPFCLHLWRPQFKAIPYPPAVMVL